MVTKEEHETDEEHDRHEHEEEDVELCSTVWQLSLGEKQESYSRNPRQTSEFKKGINTFMTQQALGTWLIHQLIEIFLFGIVFQLLTTQNLRKYWQTVVAMNTQYSME